MASTGCTCVFCLKAVKDPVTLACGHDICATCVQEARAFSEVSASFADVTKTKKKPQPDSSKKDNVPCIKCPLCGTETPLSDCKPDLVLRAVASREAELSAAGEDGKLVCGFCKEPATRMCLFCGSLCAKHSDFLHVQGPMKSHEVKVLEDGKNPGKIEWLSAGGDESEKVLGDKMPLCSVHHKRCELFCQSCNALICTHCIYVGGHKDHKYIGTSELFGSIVPEILKLSKQVAESVPLCEGLLRGFECLEKNAESERKQLTDEVDNFFRSCHEVVDKNRLAVLKSMDQVYSDFEGTVDQRKDALKTLHMKCDDFLSRVAKEESLPKTKSELYSLFRTLTDLNAVMDVVSSTAAPDEKSKICAVYFKKQLIEPNYVLATAKPKFRLGSGRYNAYPINLEALRDSSSHDSEINALEQTSHDGSAFYDPVRNIILAVSGNGNNCRDVVITHITAGVHGDSRRYDNIIPFGSHGQYPIFDGVEYAYFCQSEDDDCDRFGRLNLDSMEFEELARIPDGFNEFCSGCCAKGKIYALNNEEHLHVFDPSVGTWERTAIDISCPCRLLTDPLDDDHFYVLHSDRDGLQEVNVDTFVKTDVSNVPAEFDLNQNGEALIIALPDMSRALFSYLEEGWFCYLFETNEWIRLDNWDRARNGSAHFVIIPEGPTALFHIDGNRQWTAVTLA